MGFLDGSSAASEIAAQLMKRQKIITFNSPRSNIDALMDQACLVDPRLIGCVANWKGSSSTTGSLGINKRYELEIQYDEYLPENISEVLIDNGTWRPMDEVKRIGRIPEFMRIITKDDDGLEKRTTEDCAELHANYMGPLTISMQARHRSGEYTCVAIIFSTYVDQRQYDIWQKMAQRQAANISQNQLGGKTPPPFMRAFLALSYLQQTCRYDDETSAIYSADPSAEIARKHVFYPYGPICRGEGLCEGISGAFKMLMDQVDIECSIISGEVNGEKHKWNIVQLDGMYYHVDPTAGISGDGVYVGEFLKTDRDMVKENYLWDTDLYPSCMGRRYSYYSVEEYIEDNGNELLCADVEPSYLMPGNVFE